ncbi:hypothetical protein E2C01_038370 [Portunus trituberculatus]|uniref:Uncharacterized protein n=1 Tax=Portunus trituberculatus TaxID=210409 RepID=A0A5B7FC19_PORTR|nr:hypothetical protein [Portunus trituberculatus]
MWALTGMPADQARSSGRAFMVKLLYIVERILFGFCNYCSWSQSMLGKNKTDCFIGVINSAGGVVPLFITTVRPFILTAKSCITTTTITSFAVITTTTNIEVLS